MSSVNEFISAIAPAYVGDARITIFTTLATTNTSRCQFGENYEYAIALRVCHMICRNPSAAPGTAGAVTSQSEGEISQSYVIPPYLQNKYPDLCSTPYGCQLAQLIEENVVGHMTSGGSQYNLSSSLLSGEQI